MSDSHAIVGKALAIKNVLGMEKQLYLKKKKRCNVWKVQVY
jgi:hypothetical protein